MVSYCFWIYSLTLKLLWSFCELAAEKHVSGNPLWLVAGRRRKKGMLVLLKGEAVFLAVLPGLCLVQRPDLLLWEDATCSYSVLPWQIWSKSWAGGCGQGWAGSCAWVELTADPVPGALQGMLRKLCDEVGRSATAWTAITIFWLEVLALCNVTLEFFPGFLCSFLVPVFAFTCCSQCLLASPL